MNDNRQKNIMLQITTGNENQRSASATIQVFAHVNGKESPHFVELKKTGPKLISGINNPSFMPARRGIREDIGGKWVTQDVSVKEGTLLKVVIQATLPNIVGKSMVSLFIGPRDEAPLHRIVIPLGLGSDSVLSQATIEGRFDVMTLEEATEEGAKVPEHFQRFFSVGLRPRVMQIEQIEPEDTPRRIKQQIMNVTTSAGEVKQVALAVRRRNIEL